MRNAVRLILVFMALLVVLVSNVGAQNNEICFCHNVNNNPHTICTATEAHVNAHTQHVNNGTDLFGRCEDVLVTPSATLAPTSTPNPTATSVPTATFTDMPPTATPNSTSTNIPPSPTFTFTATQPPTNTLVPPTATGVPPTNTSIPPSLTPDPTSTDIPPSPTATATSSPSITPDPTPTSRLTNTPTLTPVLEITLTPLSLTSTPTSTGTAKPTATLIPEETPEEQPSATPTSTDVPPQEPTPTPLPETGGGISCSTPERVTIRVVTGVEGDGKLIAFWSPSGEGDYALIRWATAIEDLESAEVIRTEDDGVYVITGLQQVHYWIQVQAADDDCGGLWSEPYDPLP